VTDQKKYTNSINVKQMVYSTLEVARLVGVHKYTLLRWLYTGAVAEPKRQIIGGQIVRIWTDRDLGRARKYKQENYRRGRGHRRVLAKLTAAGARSS
jgi:hypothetical protein